MIKRMVGALCVLALVFAFSTASYAQEETKKEPAKQEMKKEPAKQEMKKDEMVKKETAMGPMKTFDCGTECGFMAKSHDEKELMAIAKTHLKTHHKMTPSDKDLKAMLKSETPEGMKHD